MTLDLVPANASEPLADQADTKLLKNLAELHQKFGVHDTAINFLGLSLWIDRNDSEALVLLARSLFHVNEFGQTLQCLQRIEDLSGGLADDQEMMRASALALSGQPQQTNQAHR